MAATDESYEEPEWTLGDRLRKAREHAHMNQDELAAVLDRSRDTVIAWEKDKRSPTVEVLQRWAEATKVSAEWLIRTGSYRAHLVALAADQHQMELALDVLPPTLNAI